MVSPPPQALLSPLEALSSEREVTAPFSGTSDSRLQILGRSHIFRLCRDADTTGTWTTMYIELMTGDNFNQVHLKSESPPCCWSPAALRPRLA